jgi:asparagine synthase (glutamine-hydrolysing)
MCGICGFVLKELMEPVEITKAIERMTQTLRHRGPDGQGIRIISPPLVPSPVALGHRRLAIIDLSESGAQPMSNEDETIWVVFNGEIYNFQELRQGLLMKGHRFRSRTDTEVLVHLYEEEGAEFVKQLNGIFTFAILDLTNKRLLLARDPIGIKPLYYWHSPRGFFFASEIKAILTLPFYSLDVNWQAVYDYFTYLYVPCPETVFRGIKHLPPAHFLLLDLESGAYSIERCWQVRRIKELAHTSFSDLQEMVRELLADSVKRQMISDVPLGIFLSGGIDSTIVAGLAKNLTLQ